MEKLSHKFAFAIREIGMKELKHPIFYNAPIGIRFEIGGNEGVYLKKMKMSILQIQNMFQKH